MGRSMQPVLNNPVRYLTTIWHKVAGRIWFRLGRAERSRRHFEQVLLLRGDDFTAYLYLASIAYSARDYSGWRRELAHAERTAPQRYAQLKFPFELFEPPQDDRLFEEAGERATWRAFRLTSVGGSSEFEDQTDVERRLSSCPGGNLRRFGDDFLTAQERRRFADLPVIRREDLVGIDLDKLSEEL